MKQYIVVFSPRAQAQLGNLYTYIAERGGEDRAERLISGIIDFCKNFSTFPERARNGMTCGKIYEPSGMRDALPLPLPYRMTS